MQAIKGSVDALRAHLHCGCRESFSHYIPLKSAMRLLLPAVFFLSAILLCAAQAQYPRPRRPERFDTAEQISNYLKELQEYYSVHGRGRYGKRQMHIADASVIFREMPFFENSPNDDGMFKNLGYK